MTFIPDECVEMKAVSPTLEGFAVVKNLREQNMALQKEVMRKHVIKETVMKEEEIETISTL